MADILKLLSAFVSRVEAEKLQVEGVAVAQGNDVFAQHRFTEDTARNIFSHTKSFTSTAVGILVTEGKLSLKDKIVDILEEYVPQKLGGGAGEITLEDVLKMSSGINKALLMQGDRGEDKAGKDYVGYILSHDVVNAPGSVFYYSNGDTYLAGRAVEKAAGETLRDFLNRRLFKHMDIPYPEWEHCPQGHTFGASGMRLKLTDMMKLGILYRDNGIYNGRELISPQWIETATAHHIDTPGEPNDYWHCGYGYQIWQQPYPQAYRFDGAYGQITTVLSRAHAVVAIQCAETGEFDNVKHALHQEILTRL